MRNEVGIRNGEKVNAEVGMRKSERMNAEVGLRKEKISSYAIHVSDTVVQYQTILLFGVSTKYNLI